MSPTPALSFSSARTYQECPLRWKFLYVDKLPEAPRGYFSFGRTIHAVLEELIRPLLVPGPRITPSGDSQRTLDEWRPAGVPAAENAHLMSVDELLALYQRLWVKDGYLSADDETRYRALGQDLLLRYHRSIAAHPPQPVAVEQHLEASWDGIPVHGYIDRIDRTAQGGLEVVDYKTSRELTQEDSRDSDQLSLYQILVEKNYSEPVERLTLYHLRSLTPLSSPPRERPTLDALYDRMGTVSDGIRTESFEPTPGRHCARCEFRSLCPEFRLAPTEERQKLVRLVDRLVQLRGEEGRLAEELRATAEELHQSADRLGVHRMPGSQAVAIRRKEEFWSFPTQELQPVLEGLARTESPETWTADAIRRLLHDPRVDPETRRRIAAEGTRKVEWYWDIQDGTPAT